MVIDERRRHRRTEASRGLPSKLSTFAVLVAWATLMGQTAHAQARDPWRLQPSLSIGETWSDNINLAAPGSERSDLVTNISPALQLTRLGSRLKVDFVYRPQLLYYAQGTNGSTLRNYLDAVANATLVENLLFFDARASVSQENVSPFGSLAANSVNGSNNRTESRNYSFGPSLRSRFGNDISYSTGYRYTGSSYNSNAVATNHTSEIYGNIQSATTLRDIGVGANFDRTDQVYGGANEIIVETVGSNLTYTLSPTIHLRANVGYDRNHYPAAPDRGLSGVSYSGGFDWNPTRHTSLSAQVGHRYFGPTANISLNQATAHAALHVSFTRDQTTSSSAGLGVVANPEYALLDQILLASIPDPIQRALAVASFLARAGLSTARFGTTGFISTQLYVQKRFEVSLALLGLRNNVTLNVFRAESQALSTLATSFDVFNQASKFRQTGYSANWSHTLGPRTSANVSVQKFHNKALSGSGDTKQQIILASINRQFQRRLSGSLQYRNTRQDSNGGGNGGNFFSSNYRENAVIGSLNLTF